MMDTNLFPAAVFLLGSMGVGLSLAAFVAARYLAEVYGRRPWEGWALGSACSVVIILMCCMVLAALL